MRTRWPVEFEHGAAMASYALTVAAVTVVTLGSVAVLGQATDDALTQTASRMAGSIRTPPTLPLDPGDDGFDVPITTTTTTAPATAASEDPEPMAAPVELAAAPNVVSIKGNVEVVGAYPSGVDLSSTSDDFDHNNKMFVFGEGQRELDGDWVVPGSSPSVVLGAGDTICAYYVHYSPATGDRRRAGRRSIEFADPIIGWVGDENGLDASDTWSGADHPSSPTYHIGGRGLEPGEQVEVEGATLHLDGWVSSADLSDDLRVFTEC